MLVIDEPRCVHRLAARARCQACVQSCPRSAWSIDAEGLGFDAARCDGCGLCMAACPTGALAVALPWPVPRPAGGGRFTVALRCERATPVGPPGAALPCVDAVDEARLLRWHAQGVGRLDVHTGACAACARRPRDIGLRERVRRLNEALRARGQHGLRWVDDADRSGAAVAPAPAAVPEDAVTPAMPAAAPAEPPPDLGRRGLLGLRAATAPKTAAVKAAQEPAPLPSPSHTSTQGAACAALPAPPARSEAAERLQRLGPGPVLWAVTANPRRCDACGACARLCPTQAIALVPPPAAGGGGALCFEMARCVGCALCVDVCDALALSSAAPLSMLSTRRAWALTILNCRACGKGYRALQAPGVAGGDLCPSCRSVGARPARLVQRAPPPVQVNAS